MAEEKFRRELKDIPSMPKFTIVMLVLSVVQILLLVYAYIGVALDEILWVPMGLAAIVMAVVAGFTWHNTPLVRRIYRTVLIAFPTLMGGIGLVTGIIAATNEPQYASFNFTLFSTMGLMWVQLITLFMTPVLLVMASCGAIFDRVLLVVFSVITTALTPYFFFYTEEAASVPLFHLEETPVMMVFMLFSAVFTLMTLLPMLASNPERRIRPKK